MVFDFFLKKLEISHENVSEFHVFQYLSFIIISTIITNPVMNRLENMNLKEKSDSDIDKEIKCH